MKRLSRLTRNVYRASCGRFGRPALFCVSLISALHAQSLAAVSSSDANVSVTPDECASVTLIIEEPYESVRVGGLALASDAVLGGPPECVSSASADSSNVRVALQKKGEFANVRIWALHEGFAYVTVRDVRGVEIGIIKVSVYPREPHPHKGGR